MRLHFAKSLLLALLSTLFARPVLGQIVINSTELGMSVGDTSFVIADSDPESQTPLLAKPAAGSDLSWDYSNVRTSGQQVSADTLIRRDASSASTINATFSTNEPFTYLPDEPLDTRFYYRFNTNTYSRIAQQIVGDGQVSTDLGSINLETDILAYSGGSERLAVFPMNYQDSWQDEFQLEIGFEVLVITGFVLARFDYESEVIGWGELTVPGNPGTYDALLVRQKRTRIDSFFNDDGSEIASTTLNAVDLEQGIETTEEVYYFYAQGIPAPVLELRFSGNTVHSTFLHRSELLAGIEETSSYTYPQLALKVYPQPARDVLTLEWDKPYSGTATARLHQLDGRLVRTAEFQTDRGRLNLEGLRAGVYLLEVHQADGRRARQKVVLR
jgi:hypothetical protein